MQLLLDSRNNVIYFSCLGKIRETYERITSCWIQLGEIRSQRSKTVHYPIPCPQRSSPVHHQKDEQYDVSQD